VFGTRAGTRVLQDPTRPTATHRSGPSTPRLLPADELWPVPRGHVFQFSGVVHIRVRCPVGRCHRVQRGRTVIKRDRICRCPRGDLGEDGYSRAQSLGRKLTKDRTPREDEPREVTAVDRGRSRLLGEPSCSPRRSMRTSSGAHLERSLPATIPPCWTGRSWPNRFESRTGTRRQTSLASSRPSDARRC